MRSLSDLIKDVDNQGAVLKYNRRKLTHLKISEIVIAEQAFGM